MKNLKFYIIIAVLIVIIIFIAKCSKNNNISNGKISLTQTELDNLIKLSSKVEIVVKDTTIYKDKIILKDKPIPVPYAVNDSVNFYIDHIKNGDIDIIINDSIRGKLLKRDFTYTPIIKMQTIETTKYIPTIVPIELANKYKISLGIVGSYNRKSKTPLIGGEIGFITKKDFSINYQIQSNFSNTEIHSIKLTKNLKF